MVKVKGEELNLVQSRKAKRFLKSLKAAALAGAIIVASTHGTTTKAAQMDADGDMFVAFDADGNMITDAEAPQAYQGEAPVIEETEKTLDSKILEAKENAQKDNVNLDIEVDTEIEDKCLPFLEDVDPAIVDENYIGIAPVGYVGLPHEMKNYGDASNMNEVTVRAEEIFDKFNEANANYGGEVIINELTGKPFTLDEIVEVIQTVNGAKAAYSDAEAKELVDQIRAFMLAFLNDKYFIEDVAYKSGNTGENGTVTLEDVEDHDNILEKIDLFTILMGDNANGPYYRWFCNKIIEMASCTDPVESAKIYDEAYKSIIAIVAGNGFVINGVNYKIDNFSRVNDLSLVIEVMISQPMRNYLNENGYIFNKEYVGEVVAFLTDVQKEFNALCADDLVDNLENNGVLLHEGVTKDPEGNNLNLRNYGNVMQINTLAQSLYVGAYGDQYYDDEYLNEYNGPYETNGSEFVFKK